LGSPERDANLAACGPLSSPGICLGALRP
jgi:hypothetical protein